MVGVDPHDDCQDPGCTRIDGYCVGMHCAYCGKPCSMMGHEDCLEAHRAAQSAEAPQEPLETVEGLRRRELEQHRQDAITRKNLERRERIENERATQDAARAHLRQLRREGYTLLGPITFGDPGVPD